MKIHDLKSTRPTLVAVASGSKTAELRYDDRGYEIGDLLMMRDWVEPQEEYGRLAVVAQITHITHQDGSFGALHHRYVMLSLKVLHVEGR